MAPKILIGLTPKHFIGLTSEHLIGLTSEYWARDRTRTAARIRLNLSPVMDTKFFVITD